MNPKHNAGKETPAVTSLLPQETVVKEIKDALSHGYRRLFVVGPARSKRLACIRQALGSKGPKMVVIDLASVRSRLDLDAAARRDTLGNGFVDCMLRLERQSKRRPVAVIFHNLDECQDLSDEGYAFDTVWMAAKCNCQFELVVFTATNPDFPGWCFDRYKNCRTFVRQIQLSCSDRGGGAASSGK